MSLSPSEGQSPFSIPFFIRRSQIMGMPVVRFRFSRSQTTTEIDYAEGDTYADLILRCGLIPDTVLIFVGDRSIPEDAVVCEEDVTIEETASRG
jgi:sulfur carrier protein ThiS